jgi:flavorubredoxin
MTKAIVIYHTQFGNTEKIVQALVSGMVEQEVDVDCMNVEDVQVDKLMEYDLLVIGGPTHGFGMSKPMKTFMKKLEHEDLRGKNAFAFDTKFGTRFAGSAGRGIEKRLKRLGLNIVKQRASATVKGGKGPLLEGMEEKFKQIGAELASL